LVRELAFCEAQHKFNAHKRRIALEGLRLCYGCRSALDKDLALLPDFWRELHRGVTLSLSGGMSRSDPLVSGTRARGIVYDAAALNCASQMERDLAYYAKAILGQPGASVGIAVPRLRRELDRVCGHTLAPHVRAVCRELVGTAYSILDPAGRPREIGPCIEVVEVDRRTGTCTGTLYMRGEGVRAELSCHSCGVKVPPRKWKRYLAAYAESYAEVVEVKGDLL
jgi:hypothetical protein